MDTNNCVEQTAFHIQLKNGHYYDYLGCLRYGKEIKLIGNHIVIFIQGAFRAAFALSEVAYACAVKKFFNFDTDTLLDEPPKGS